MLVVGFFFFFIISENIDMRFSLKPSCISLELINAAINIYKAATCQQLIMR